MFRNVSKPATLDRLKTGELNGEYEQAYPTCDETNVVASKPVSRIIIDTRSGHSAPKDVKTLQPKCQNKSSVNTKGMHSTSLYVNGTIPKPKSSINVPVSQRQNQHQQLGDKKTEGLSQPRPVPNTKQRPTSSRRPDVQNRRSTPQISDVHSLTNCEHNYSSTDPNSNHYISQDKTISSQHTDGVFKASTKSNHSSDSRTKRTGTTSKASPEVPVPEKPSRHSLYSQEKYNVVPPPPPLVEPVFAGRRDVLHPDSVHERQIVSVKGTVRGFKNRVRAGIATFWAQSEDKVFQHVSTDQLRPARHYRHLEQGRIVVYATSMSVVRETNERCKSVRRLLQNHMVRYEERDLYMTREIQQELHQRLSSEGILNIRLPHVFADGIHIGGADELEKLNEAGELRGLLDNYQKVIVRIMCDKCGGYRFLPCEFCHGSKKSLIRNHFTEEFCALRCMHCDENGLRRCDMCVDQQE